MGFNLDKETDRATAIEALKKLELRIDDLIKVEKKRLEREKTFLRSVLNNTGTQAATEESEQEDLSEVFRVVQGLIDLQVGIESPKDVPQPDKK